MTIAVAEALMKAKAPKMEHFEHGWYLSDREVPDDMIRQNLVQSMQKYGLMHPHAGYGGMFRRWLKAKDPQPYGSYGNGSAMRVSSVAWLYDDIATVRKMTRLSAEVTHNHPEGIKGAEATASAIFLARTGKSKTEIKAYVEENFGYDLSRTCDQIRPNYHHVESCQETVPEAITAFLEGESFEDVIRAAVSLGGDCDTLTCIAGSIAEAFYGVPEELKRECRNRLPNDMIQVLDRFDGIVNGK
jgi:ADP-ribosylglycohydrolase